MERFILQVISTFVSHDKSFVYQPRGFQSIDEMNEAIIERWNSVVKWDDEVYFLGDAMLCDNKRGMECLRRLNGTIHMIRGNHDTDTRWELYGALPNVVLEGWATMVKYKGYHLYMSHYPTICDNFDCGKPLKSRVVSLCGHSHTNDKFADMGKGLIYHCELDAHNCYPVALDDAIADIKQFLEKSTK